MAKIWTPAFWMQTWRSFHGTSFSFLEFDMKMVRFFKFSNLFGGKYILHE